MQNTIGDTYFQINVRYGKLDPESRAARKVAVRDAAKIPETSKRYKTRAAAETAFAKLYVPAALAPWLEVQEVTDINLLVGQLLF